MVSFRKMFVLVALVASLSMIASAQFTCTSSAGSPPVARQEGLAEEVGQLVLNCIGGVPTAAGAAVPQVNVSVFLNTNLNSRSLDGSWTEALLLIDEPAVGDRTLCSVGLGSTHATPWNASLGTCPMTGMGAGANQNMYKGARANVWQGFKTADNTVTFSGVPLDPPGTTFARQLRIVNVRANANGIITSGFVPGQIQMFIAITGTGAPGIQNNQQTVAFVQKGLQVDVRNAAGDDVAGNPVLAACSGSNTKAPSTTDGNGGCVNFRLRFLELFNTAFRPRGTQGAQNNFNSVYNTESMFNDTGLITSAGGGSISGRGDLTNAGYASNPTRLIARFTSLPSGVRIFTTNNNLSGTSGTDTISRNTPLEGLSTGTTNSTCTPAANASQGYREVPLTSGAGSVTYDVTANNPATSGSVELGVIVVFAAGAPAGGQATVAGNYAPISTSSGTVPRFVDSAMTPVNAFQIAPCRTNILFPYVTNQAGFDTGIAISNTSDVTGTSGLDNGNGKQAGTCVINYYGTTTGGGAAPAAQTSASVAAGTQLVFNLSGGGNNGIVATPGFQGYIIAQCNFQYAHGLAFLSDIGASKFSTTYLGLIMDQPLGTFRSNNAAESFNQ